MMPRPRRWGARGLGLAGAIALVLGIPVVAHAETVPDVLVSTDGLDFTTELGEALFDTDRLLIPGESIDASLWIMNPASEPSVLRVSAKDVDLPSGWAEEVTVVVHDTGTEQTRTAPVGSLGTCDVVVPAQSLAPGESVRTDIRFVFGDLSGTGGQNEQMTMNLTVAMRDSDAGMFPASACDDRGATIGFMDPPVAPTPPLAGTTVAGGEIARTGGRIQSQWLAAAGLAVGAGLFLVTRRRRDREDGHEPGARVRR